MRLIDADKIVNEIAKLIAYEWGYEGIEEDVKRIFDEQPTIDAVPVVRCHECIMHNNCFTEDAFNICGIENPFCCAGKRREPQAEAVEENSFLMQRFMKQE